jgi:glucose-1-phosphate thymidylyltransferase
MKGLILAGGTGSRLSPATSAVSKQLIPVFDKPMIYYPLVSLMHAGVRDICLITTPKDLHAFQNLLSNGAQFGVKISYRVQESPRGIADAYLVAEDFVEGEPSALILGDNLFHGLKLEATLEGKCTGGNRIFGHSVSNPSDYGVVDLDPTTSSIISIQEKPSDPSSNVAVTGLYFFDGTASARAKTIAPSDRGELEIVDLINSYVAEGSMSLTLLPEGALWFDTGTPESMLEAASHIRLLQSRYGTLVGSPEKTAFELGLITSGQLESAAAAHSKSSYGKGLLSILESKA